MIFPNTPALAKHPNMKPVEIEPGKGISRVDEEGNPIDRDGNLIPAFVKKKATRRRRKPAEPEAAEPEVSSEPLSTSDIMAGLTDGADD